MPSGMNKAGYDPSPGGMECHCSLLPLHNPTPRSPCSASLGCSSCHMASLHDKTFSLSKMHTFLCRCRQGYFSLVEKQPHTKNTNVMSSCGAASECHVNFFYCVISCSSMELPEGAPVYHKGKSNFFGIDIFLIINLIVVLLYIQTYNYE